MNANYHEQIDDYLLNRLSDIERSKFEEALSSDESLRTQLNENRIAHDLIHVSADEELTKRIAAQANQFNQRSKQKKREFKPAYIIIAATIAALLLFLFFQQKQPAPTELYMASYEKPTISFASRSGDIRSDNFMIEAGSAYENGEFEKALQLLEQQPSTQRNGKSLFAQAICLHELGQNQEAQELLKTLIDTKDELFDEAALWYSALIYLSENNIEAAKRPLSKLSTLSSSTYQTDAQALIDDLK